MKPITEFNSSIDVLFTDIDDTLTDHGELRAQAYSALWNLKDCGIKVVPVTGRPAGWCEMIARLWPVEGVIGENGGFYYRYADRKMKRHYVFDEIARAKNRQRLTFIESEVLSTIPDCAIASDQFSRVMDLAVDFAEDVGPLPDSSVDEIVAIFRRHGAQAKVSSIHVNGWFGEYDKLSMCREFAKRELAIDIQTDNLKCAFTGDSPNDEPMFQYFKNSFAVANLNRFITRLKSCPTYIAEGEGGDGFVQIAQRLIQFKK